MENLLLASVILFISGLVLFCKDTDYRELIKMGWMFSVVMIAGTSIESATASVAVMPIAATTRNTNSLFNSIFGAKKPILIEGNSISITVGDRELLIENTDKKKKVLSAFSKDGTCRSIQFYGQKTRVDSLIEAVNNHEDRLATNVAKSILDYQMDSYPMDVFIEDDGKVEWLKKVRLFRRAGYLTSKDKLAVILKKTDDVEEILEGIVNMEDLSSEDQENIEHTKIQEGLVYRRMVKRVEQFMNGYKFLGGNPDNGIVLFTKRKMPATNGTAQKLAKILLSGGIMCDNLSVDFKLAEFPKSIDGVFAIWTREQNEEFTLANAIRGSLLQSRILIDGITAIKGTIASPVTKMLEDILGGESAIMDVKEYNKIFNQSKKVGDMVTVNRILVLSTDSDCGPRDTHLSYQLINRAPEVIQDELFSILYSAIDKLKAQAKNNPKSFLPDFGTFKLMKDITPVMFEHSDYKTSIERELDMQVKDIMSKGPKLAGAYPYNVPANGLAFDECLLGKNIAMKLGLKIGDRVNIVIYPAHLAKDEYQSNFIFSKKIVGFLKGHTLAMSKEANDAALRDWDGDKIILFGNGVLPEFPLQSTESYSTIVEEDNDFTKLLNAPYSSSGAIKCFTHYGSSIGKLDVRVETLSKTIDLGYEDKLFCNRSSQSDIETKKHNTDAAFGYEPLNLFIKLRAPQLFGDKNRFQKHEDILVRKGNWKTVEVKRLTPEIKKLVKDASAIKLSEVAVQSAMNFREKASDMWFDLEVKEKPELKTLKADVIDYIYSLEGELDNKKALVAYLGRNIKAQIGAEAFYLLVVSLFADDRRMPSIFWPLTFSDKETLVDIDRTVIAFSAGAGLPTDVIVEVRGRDTFQNKKIEKVEGTIRIYRSKDAPCVKDGMPVVSIGSTLTIWNGDAVIDGTTFKINNNKGKSMPLCEGDVYTIEGVCLINSVKDNSVVILTGLDLKVA